MKPLLLLLAVLLSGLATAEQMRKLGNWNVHYVLIPTTFLNPDIAASYKLNRGRDRALLNISVMGMDGVPTVADVRGVVTNLLGQQQALKFSQIEEGTAVYYLAEVKHTDREVLRFEVTITPPDGSPQLLKFQQQVYVED